MSECECECECVVIHGELHNLTAMPGDNITCAVQVVYVYLRVRASERVSG